MKLSIRILQSIFGHNSTETRKALAIQQFIHLTSISWAC